MLLLLFIVLLYLQISFKPLGNFLHHRDMHGHVKACACLCVRVGVGGEEEVELYIQTKSPQNEFTTKTTYNSKRKMMRFLELNL